MMNPAPEEDSSHPRSRTITKSNILDKLCFVTFQGGLSKYKFQLRAKLYEFYQFSPDKLISRQTIQYWFDDKPSVPSRQKAFQFLFNFITNAVDYAQLSEDQKKVYTQISAFLRNNLRSITSDGNLDGEGKIYPTKSGRVVLNIAGTQERLSVIADSLVGVYKTYRMRSSGNKSAPIAREVLCVSKRQRSVHFDHWHIGNGLQPERFMGVILPVGDLLWFIGAAQGESERLRVMYFLDTPISDYRWGIVASNLSGHSSHDPTASRIFIRKVHDRIDNLTKYIKETTSFIAASDVSESHMGVVRRLVDNNVTSISYAGSATPAKTADGEAVQDSILKVNHLTLHEAIQVFSQGTA